MANSLTNVLPKILAQGLDVLAENAVIVPLINTDWSEEVAKKGDTINIPVYNDASASDVTAAATPPAVTDDVDPGTTTIVLNKWKESSFALSDKELAEAMDGVIPGSLKAAAKAIGNAVTNDVYDLVRKKVYGYVGTAGTTPFATSVAAATDARKILNKQLAPMDERRMILDPDAAANALALSAFNANAGTQEKSVMIEGQLGKKLGFETAEDQLVPTATLPAVGTGAMTVNGAHAVGVTTLSIAKAAGQNMSATEGNVFTIAGDTQTYIITAAVTITQGTNTNVTISPPLKVATVGGEAITFKATHVANVAFNKYAFALAVRQLAVPFTDLGPKMMTMTDARTGLSMRLTVKQEHYRTRWSFDILYGAACPRPEFACRIAG